MRGWTLKGGSADRRGRGPHTWSTSPAAWRRARRSWRRPTVPAPGRSPYQYVVVRVVPSVERGECFNAGVVLLCRPRRFLVARTELDETLLAAFAPGLSAAE